MKRHPTVVGLFYLAYNRHILFILYDPGEVKICHKVMIFVSDNLKKTICYFSNFSISFSLSSDMHQSITQSGCQAMGKTSSFIFDL